MGDLVPGQLIGLTDGRQAIIRFVGTTHFAPGGWIGVELEDATGKNDGAVQGERYFDCEMGHGMFVRPTAVASILEQQPLRREELTKPVVGKMSTNGAVTRGRPASAIMGSNVAQRRQSLASSTSAVKRQSAMSSPSPAPRSGITTGRSLRSPTKSPTKQLSSASTPGSRTASVNPRASISGAPRARPGVNNRPSMAPPPPATATSRTSRQSLLGPSSRPARPIAPVPRSTLGAPTKRMSLRAAAPKATSQAGSGSGASEQTDDVLEDRSPGYTPSETEPNKPSDHRSLAPLSPRSVSGGTAQHKELEDLRTKLRMMEKKRADDREKLKALEALRADREKFEGIIQKLQTKYQPQQQEISQLRKQLKEAEARAEEAERLQAEHDSIVEMAALDREMAEEMTEAIKAEFDALKVKAEELELEVEVLREENQELGQVMSPEEKSSQGWLQMERTNERLREALIRLRDMTQQQESDLRSQVKEMEEELEDYDTLKKEYETTKEKLLISEANMEDLKQQVEALGAEEMIEELTERNMQYQEEINELKAVIEDLESLKELNDELELNHVEAEKQLQEEIDYRESIYHEQTRKLGQQDEVIEDLEYTLSKFRELVSNLQNDLEDMRVSQQLTETESTELSVRSRAMIDLNMKLQASVVKAQTRSIDVEMGRMEAEESAQHLSIMKLYLPEYFESERNPVLAFLRFKRVSFKAALMNNTVRERLSDPTAISSGQEVFTALDVLDKLTWISSLCDRFINFIGGCSSEEFSGFEGALYDLEPVERILNSWIEGLKKNELNENKCAVELQRSIALLSHLTETLIPPNLEAYADDLHMRSVMTQTYMDHTALALTQLKSLLQTRLPPPGEGDEEGPYIFQKLDTLAHQARGGKLVVGKITRSLEELKSRSLTLSDECAAPFENTERAAKELAELARQLGVNVLQLTNEEGRAEELTYAEIAANMSQTAMTLIQPSASDAENSDALSLLGTKLRSLATYLEEVASVSSDLSQTVEFERQASPWIARAKELKSNQVVSPDADEEIRRLKNEVHETSTALGVKDKAFEEQTIKIELLESRMRDAGKKAALVKELEAQVEGLKVKEQELVVVVEKQSGDLQAMEQERDDYRARLEKAKRASGSTGSVIGPDGVIIGDAVASSVLRENESLRAEVAGLQAAVRFLRDENRRSNLLDPYSVQRTNNMRTWLDSPLVQHKLSVDEKRSINRPASEAQDVLTHLLKLTKESKFVDLKTTVHTDKASRLAWRPAKSTPRYHILQQRENYEQWAQWKDEVARRERERTRKEAKKNAAAAAAAQFPPSMEHIIAANASIPGSQIGDVKEDLLPKSKGVMDRAWKILGMQTEEDTDDTSAYNAPGSVRIV
ncbi:hypothetical protein AJ80_04505 [Polytolypa hystricis UAMH7299]|uniref:CAP-Gly domain-containing protein n=1 Tax=Polytolypa hystricis (strain UAMH7299) TaxID=1447883 RepID=A0A2B7YCK3_POLH7|nr:hypothetical protein AJ80_04505 [Polytolypa hystricis UAMH7299]